MPDYEKMYDVLFKEMTEALLILQRAQQDAENICIETYDAEPAPENEQSRLIQNQDRP